MYLAQLNIARLRQPLEHVDSADFVTGLDPMNALAEASTGFVWRLQTAEGDATALRPLEDAAVIVNMSVWSGHQPLSDYVYRSAHTNFLRRRAEWFEAKNDTQSVGWWIEPDHIPTLDEAFARLEFLNANGSSPFAFTVNRSAPAEFGIRRVGLDDSDVLGLIDELNAELSAIYPEPGSTFFSLKPEQVSGRNGVLLIGELAGRAVTCGAFRVLDDQPNTAEIKRMYVRPAARGLKLGAAVLAELERHAAEFGVTRMVLETGSRQAQAATVYTRAGYLPCPCWDAYADAPLSRCYTKDLGQPDLVPV